MTHHHHRLLPLLIAAAALSACAETPTSDPNPAEREQRVVYGEDDRLDYYQLADEDLAQLVRESIVALVPPDDIIADDPSDVRFVGDPLGPSLELCEDELFFDQPRIASCSGTLIDDDLVLTAGHCMSSQSRCDNRRVVFNLHYEAEGQLAQVTTDDIYACEQIVAYTDDGDIDYAIFQLDRPVAEPYRPAPVFQRFDPMEEGTPLTMIGFPSGLPAKTDSGGQVIDNRADTLDYFEATVDAFGGNSGSGVFNDAREVVGILVRGEQDYADDDEAGCTRVNVLPEDNEDTEDVTYVGRAIEDLCSQGWPSERLCQTEERGLCFRCEVDEDCRGDWTCRSWDDFPELTFCSPPCATDEDCREDHTCVEDGYCEPRRDERCRGDDVWAYDGCDRELMSVATCSETQFCTNAACVDRGEGDRCETARIIEPVDQVIEGDLGEGFDTNRRGTCGGRGPDQMFTFTLEEERVLTARAGGFDSVLHLRTDCTDQDTEVACNDDFSDDDESAWLRVPLQPGTYTLILDAWDNDVAPYTLELTFGYVCQESCEPGTSICADDATRTCATDERGCPFYDEPEPCAEGTSCVEGACVEPSAGDTCDNPIVLDAVDQVVEGDYEAPYANDYEGSCGGAGPEQVFAFELDAPTVVEILAYGSERVYDTIIYLRQTCDERNSEEACNDDEDPPGDRGSGLTATLAPGTWFLFLDTYDEITRPYNLDLTFTPACEDACEADAAQCGDDNAVLTCAEGEDGCLEWVVETECADTERCEEATCVLACEDACPEEGAVQCMGSGTARCALDPETGCLDWGMPATCGADEVCRDGACEAAPEPDAGMEGDADTDTGVEVASSSSGDGGCSALPGRAGDAGAWLVWVMLVLGWGWRRRAP